MLKYIGAEHGIERPIGEGQSLAIEIERKVGAAIAGKVHSDVHVRVRHKTPEAGCIAPDIEHRTREERGVL